MKRLLIAAALAFAAVGQASAADLPGPAPMPPQAPAAYMPMVAPVYNWGGIYYGVNGGYGFGSSTWTPLAGTPSGSFTVNGFVVGPTLGANYQVDAFVFGIEGDLDYAGLTGNTGAIICGGSSCRTSDTWLGTLRGRVGYAADRVLFYGTAGGAFGNIRSDLTSQTNYDSSTKMGWTAGAGVEAAFADNWTARIEYLYVGLQNGSCTTTTTCAIGQNYTTKFDANLVRFGIDYKFR